MKMIYECPRCYETVIYKQFAAYNKALSNKVLCRKCKQRQWPKPVRVSNFENWKLKYGEAYAIKKYKAMCDKMSVNHPDVSGKNNPIYGTTRIFTDIWRRRLGKASKRVIRTREWCTKISESLKGHSVSAEVRYKLRLSRLARIQTSGWVVNYNKTACKYFDWLNMYMGWNGQHALNGGEKIIRGYWLDYYEPNLNLVIEWDEKSHYKNGNLLEKDIKRQTEIIQTIGCDFYRIRQATMQVMEVN